VLSGTKVVAPFGHLARTCEIRGMRTLSASVVVSCCFLACCNESTAQLSSAPATPTSLTTETDVPVGAVRMGRVQGVVCVKELFAPTPKNEVALTQLKLNAANMGASGIADVEYKTLGLTMSPYCAQSVRATAIAFHR
jgi:hypothetical protein